MNHLQGPRRALTAFLSAALILGVGNAAHADEPRGKPAAAQKAKKDAAAETAARKKTSKATGKRAKTAKSSHAPKRRAATADVSKKSEREERKKEAAAAEKKKKEACLHTPVELAHGTEKAKVALTTCDGKATTAALTALTSIARPHGVAKPDLEAVADGDSAKKAAQKAGLKVADPGLVTRLQAIADHFQGKRISVVSGYRPTAKSGYHKDARALDVHVDGVKNEDLVTYCRSLSDTGCGYYPKSSFVHVDVRPKGTGHVYWIDASGPGEAAKYVAAWPPPKDTEATVIPRPDPQAPSDEHTHDGAKGVDRGDDDRDRAEAAPDGDVSPTG